MSRRIKLAIAVAVVVVGLGLWGVPKLQDRLHWMLSDAVDRGDLEQASQLLRLGVDPDEFVPGTQPALWTAAGRGFDQTVKELLDAGGDPNVKNALGQTPIEHAVFFGRESTLRLLLSRGADPNQGREGALLLAVRFCNVPLAKVLLEAGADPTRPNHPNVTSGWTPPTGPPQTPESLAVKAAKRCPQMKTLFPDEK
jgi:ankyrin repeat protein